MPLISHKWPGINPLTFGDLPYTWWCLYVQLAKDLEKEAADHGD
jgi:hypothetical protein